MPKLTVIVVEDEAPARRRVCRFVEKHAQLQLLDNASSAAEARQLLAQQQPDLLLLDIELKDENVFDLIQDLPRSYAGKIIFITAYDHYAVKAFEVFALDYILKPFSEKRLLEAIDRRLQREDRNDVQTVQENQAAFQGLEDKLQIMEGKTQHFFDVEAIVWIQAQDYYCAFHLADGSSQLLRISLKALEGQLPADFLRINRSEMINLRHVTRKRQLKREEEYWLTNGRSFIRTKGYMA